MSLLIKKSSIIFFIFLITIFLEFINIRVAQIIFVVTTLFLLFNFLVSKGYFLLGIIFFILSFLVNLAHYQLGLSGILFFSTIIAAQFIYHEYSIDPLKIFKSTLLLWGLIIIYLLFSFNFNLNIADAISGSHNHLNTLLLPFFLIASCILIRLNKDPFIKNTKFHTIAYITLSITSFIISIFFTGRTGVILGLIGILTVYFLTRKQTRVTDLVIILSIPYIIIHFLEVLIFFQTYSGGIQKFAMVNLQNDVRFEIILFWLEDLSNINTWLGYQNNYFMNKFGVGSHNGFIQIYGSYGILGFSLFMFIVFYCLILMIKMRNFSLIAIFSLLLIRIFSDSVANSIGIMICFWFIVLLSLHKNVTKQNF